MDFGHGSQENSPFSPPCLYSSAFFFCFVNDLKVGEELEAIVASIDPLSIPPVDKRELEQIIKFLKDPYKYHKFHQKYLNVRRFFKILERILGQDKVTAVMKTLKKRYGSKRMTKKERKDVHPKVRPYSRIVFLSNFPKSPICNKITVNGLENKDCLVKLKVHTLNPKSP